MVTLPIAYIGSGFLVIGLALGYRARRAMLLSDRPMKWASTVFGVAGLVLAVAGFLPEKGSEQPGICILLGLVAITLCAIFNTFQPKR